MSGARSYLGTSSWSEKDWVGPFYPQGTKPAGYLSLYAEQFDAVEADVTYYRVPDARLVDGWRAKTPAGFKLCAKFPRSIVHAGSGPKPDGSKVLRMEFVSGDTERFITAMQRLGDRCGPLVLQFPYFNKSAFQDLEPFLERLDAYLSELPKDLRYAVEVRNKHWISAPLLACLRKHAVALVLVDLLYMPHPKELVRLVGGEPSNLLTTDFTYLRLIGDRKRTEAATEHFDHIALDLTDRLDAWAELLVVLRTQVDEVYAFANNHFAGYGPGTIRDFAQRL